MLRYLPQLSSTLEYEQKTTSNNYPIFFHLFPVPFPFPSHHPPEFFPRLWHPLARKKRSAQAAAGECFEARSFPWPEVAVWRFPRLELELQEEPAWGKAWDFRGNYEKCIIIYDYIYLWDTCRNLWKFIYGNLWKSMGNSGKSMGSKVEMISNTENLWHLRYLDEVEK